MEVTTKTPVQILYEYAAATSKGKLRPQYELICNRSLDDPPGFIMRVSLGEMSADGVGKTKKEAKIHATELLLQTISHRPNASEEDIKRLNKIGRELTSNQSDAITFNAVGELMQTCQKKGIPAPVFECRTDFVQGKTFIFTCTLKEWEEVGSGSTKKLAKQKAAQAMLVRLKSEMANGLELPDRHKEKNQPPHKKARFAPPATGQAYEEPVVNDYFWF